LAKQKFSDEVVADFIMGFKLVEMLELPQSALFDVSSFATFLNPLKCEGLHLLHIR